VIISAGTLLKSERKTFGLCEKTSYYLIDLYEDRVEGTQMKYNYSFNSFYKHKVFREKSHLPKFYKLNVDLTWEIVAPNFDSKVTRILTFRAWQGKMVTEIVETIGSTVRRNFEDLNFSVHRTHGNATVSDVTQMPVDDVDLKDVRISLDPPMYYVDDQITITYTWPEDFREDLSKNYVEDSYFEPYFIDEFTLRIKSRGFNIRSCRIWSRNLIVNQPIDANTWEFSLKGLQPRRPIYYALSF